MKTTAFGIFVICLAGAAITPLQAQATSGASSTTPPTAPGPGELRSAMRQLVVAEEGFYADHGTYTTDIAALGLLKPSTVWFQVVHAGGRSWIADVSTPGEPRRSCVAFVGELTDFPSVPVTASKQLKPTEQGEPVCDPD